MKLSYYVALAFITLSSLAMASYLTPWSIGDNYEVKFSGKSAAGTFSGLAGEIVFSSDDPSTARMDVSVQVATINTGNKTKDKHARGDSWFNAERYPTIRFVSNKISRQGSKYVAEGELTMHGHTKAERIPFTFVDSANGGVFEGSFTVDRQEYGMEGPWMAFTVGDEFEISLRVPVRE